MLSWKRIERQMLFPWNVGRGSPLTLTHHLDGVARLGVVLAIALGDSLNVNALWIYMCVHVYSRVQPSVLSSSPNHGIIPLP